MPFGFHKQPDSYSKKANYTFHKHEPLLGTGGFSEVRKAEWNGKDGFHPSGRRQVALKVVTKSFIQDKENYHKIMKAMSKMTHDHIIKTWDFFESSSKYYIAFELAEGGELFDRLVEKPYMENEAREAVWALLDSTAYVRKLFLALRPMPGVDIDIGHCADELGVIHRDIKPENYLFRNRNNPKDFVLSDFGIAKVLDDPNENEVLYEICGTPGYAAPEIYRNNGYNRKCDIFSIGVVTYAILTAWSPWVSTTYPELIEETLHSKVNFPNSRWQYITDEAKDFIRLLLEPDPAKRPSAREAMKHKWLSMDGQKVHIAPAKLDTHGPCIARVPTITQDHPLARQLSRQVSAL